MKLVTAQKILQNPALRWGSSFIFVTGVYACLVLVALNRPSTAQTILSPLGSAVLIDLPPLATIPETTPQSEPEPEPEPEPEQIPREAVNKLPDIETAEAILPSQTKPQVKKEAPPKRKKPVLKKPTPEAIAPPVEELTAAPTPSPINTQSSAIQAQASETWQSNLLAHIQRYKRYPRQARRRGQEAVIYVQVTITRDGQVVKHQLEKASQYKTLNREVLNLITRAQPLPPPPKEIKDETLEILLPVVFSLRR
ncbi:MAG: energy transducer TonB [Pseudomonadales bacterium]|nr:energy transducer TonB [Pseudomonadales bacterium]